MEGGMAESGWKEEVQSKLVSVFEVEDPEALARILFYLTEEDKWYAAQSECREAPAWKALKSLLPPTSIAAFRSFAKRLAMDTMSAERDERFKASLRCIYDNLLGDFSEAKLPEDAPGSGQCLDLERLAKMNKDEAGAAMGLVRAWTRISLPAREQILQVVRKFVESKQVCLVEWRIKFTSQSCN
jgi:hypothetical protein